MANKDAYALKFENNYKGVSMEFLSHVAIVAGILLFVYSLVKMPTYKIPPTGLKGNNNLPNGNSVEKTSIENYHLKFMVDGIKLEFSHFRSPIQSTILQNAQFQPYDENAKLKILALKDIISLKIFALFNRQKTRDLFDASIILEKNLLDIQELERIYSYIRDENSSIRDYIAAFKAVDDDGDNSLDFLSEHEYYKVFAKKSQNDRFIKAKEMFLDQYTQKQQETLVSIKKVAIKNEKMKK